MSDEPRTQTDAWLNALGFGSRLIDGRSGVGGLLARVVGRMSDAEFDEWRFGKMLDRNYLRNRFGVGVRRG
jgi:hypothetical protein